MTPVARNFVLFKTDLFVFHQEDEDIGAWFVGGDCAGWFYARLLLVDRIQPHLEPVMEDWGWTFAVLVDGVRVSIDVWAFFEVENCWLFGVEAKKRLFGRQSSETLLGAEEIVRSACETIMAGDLRIVKHAWFAENPFDLGVMDF